MDSITQAALGAVVGELVLGKKLGWRAAAWGAFFGTLPDLDVLASPFLSEAQRLAWHRGLSHSLLSFFLAPLLLCFPLAALHRKRQVGRREAFNFLFLVWSTHVLIDCFTAYGTQIFTPFSDYRFALNNLYIIDLFFTIPLLVSLLVIFWYRPTDQRRRQLNTIALSISTLYVCLSFGMKGWAHRVITQSISESLPGTHLVATYPTISNILLWRGLIESDEAYWITYWSPFDRDPLHFDYVEKNHQLLPAELRDEEIVQSLLWFSCDHYVVRESSQGHPVVIDMRFNEVRDPSQHALCPIFQWHLRRDAEGHLRAPHLRPSGLDYRAALTLTIDRVRGERDLWDSLSSAFILATPEASPHSTGTKSK